MEFPRQVAKNETCVLCKSQMLDVGRDIRAHNGKLIKAGINIFQFKISKINITLVLCTACKIVMINEIGIFQDDGRSGHLERLGIFFLFLKIFGPNGNVNGIITLVFADIHPYFIGFYVRETEFERGEFQGGETAFQLTGGNHGVIVMVADDEIFDRKFERRTEVDMADGDAGVPFFGKRFRHHTDHFFLNGGHKKQSHQD